MVDRNDQDLAEMQNEVAKLTARVVRQDRTIVELLEVLVKLASSLPAIGGVGAALAKVKALLATYKS